MTASYRIFPLFKQGFPASLMPKPSKDLLRLFHRPKQNPEYWTSPPPFWEKTVSAREKQKRTNKTKESQKRNPVPRQANLGCLFQAFLHPKESQTVWTTCHSGMSLWRFSSPLCKVRSSISWLHILILFPCFVHLVGEYPPTLLFWEKIIEFNFKPCLVEIVFLPPWLTFSSVWSYNMDTFFSQNIKLFHCWLFPTLLLRSLK